MPAHRALEICPASVDNVPQAVAYDSTAELVSGQRISNPSKERVSVNVAKIVEISSESTESFDDAVKRGIKRANKTLQNVRGAWVAEQKVIVENGDIVRY